jgi:hypothetical protein
MLPRCEAFGLHEAAHLLSLADANLDSRVYATAASMVSTCCQSSRVGDAICSSPR